MFNYNGKEIPLETEIKEITVLNNVCEHCNDFNNHAHIPGHPLGIFCGDMCTCDHSDTKKIISEDERWCYVYNITKKELNIKSNSGVVLYKLPGILENGMSESVDNFIIRTLLNYPNPSKGKYFYYDPKDIVNEDLKEIARRREDFWNSENHHCMYYSDLKSSR